MGDLEYHSHPVTPLEAQVLYDGDRLSLPAAIAIAGDDLVVIDLARDSVIHVIDRTGAGHVASLGRRGEGPGEFAGAWSIQATADGQVWVYDVVTKSMTPIEPECSACSEGRVIRLDVDMPVLDPIWMDGLLVGVGLFGLAHVVYFDREGKLVRTVEVVGADVLPAAYEQRRIVSDHADTRLAVAARYADRLELLDVRDDRVRLADAPFDFAPPDDAASEVRFAYIDLAASERHLFALFSGRARGGSTDPANFGRDVRVYNWEGRLLHVYRLDYPAPAIAVDPTGRHIYAIHHEPAPAVARYRVP